MSLPARFGAGHHDAVGAGHRIRPRSPLLWHPSGEDAFIEDVGVTWDRRARTGRSRSPPLPPCSVPRPPEPPHSRSVGPPVPRTPKWRESVLAVRAAWSPSAATSAPPGCWQVSSAYRIGPPTLRPNPPIRRSTFPIRRPARVEVIGPSLRARGGDHGDKRRQQHSICDLEQHSEALCPFAGPGWPLFPVECQTRRAASSRPRMPPTYRGKTRASCF